jgi:Fe-coproporphyrin III synthase
MQAKHLLNLVGNQIATLPLVVLYITDGCNSRCKMCDIWKNPRRNISMDLVDDFVAQVESLKIQHVLLSGGEAMQHPQWDEIARRFREASVRTMLLTNGLLVKKQIDRFTDCVDELIFSLDGGTAETYVSIRGVDAFDLVLDGIRLAKGAGLKVTTRTTVQRENFRELPLIIQSALSAGADAVSFLAIDVSNPFAFGERFADLIPLTDTTQALNRDEITELNQLISQLECDFGDEFEQGRISESPDKLRRILVQYFSALIGDESFPRPRCNAPHFSTVIEVDGTLRPCYFLPSYGSLRVGDKLDTILNNETAIDLRKAYSKGERQECARCVCPLYKGPRSLLRM